MKPFPHHYLVSASVRPGANASLQADKLPGIVSSPPEDFGGPGDQWSPEALLTASVVDCFTLNFAAIASASKFEWIALEARTTGTLERADGKLRFTRFDTHAQLTVGPGANPERARLLLEKAESTCLISNSLSCERHLTVDIRINP
ncbi:MAG TPA: OsmC family protein [Steroidobacteraceae bacterium]|jgi:organic hydroperoxide reductase OsmC/OhrA|nr:OsmC family protein [Steroidobacteraceae bacterium]